MASEPVTDFSDVAVIVRECGERTTSACIDLLQRTLGVSKVHTVSDRPFSATLRKSLELGLSLGHPWTLCIDADVLALPGLTAFIRMARREPVDTFAFQALVVDKLLCTKRPAGNHLYRTALIPQAIPLIPTDNAVRPETAMIRAMDIKGFALHQSRHVVGLHDFEQTSADIYAKAYLHAHKHRHLEHDYLPIWRYRSQQDTDFLVALQAWEDSQGSSAPQVSRSFTDQLIASGKLNLPAKPLLEVVPKEQLQRFQAELLAPAAEIATAIRNLQAGIDAAVFPRQNSKTLPMRLHHALKLSARWLQLVWRISAPSTRIASVRENGKTAHHSRKKLLFVIDSLVGGGAERVLCRLASELNPSLYDVQIALTLGKTTDVHPAAHVQIVSLTDRIPESLRTPPGGIFWCIEQLTSLWLLLAQCSLGEIRVAKFVSLSQGVRSVRKMAAVLGRHTLAWQPDCIVSFLPNSNLITLLSKSWYKLSAPIICSDRNFLSSEIERLPWAIARRKATRDLYPQAFAHVAVTPQIAEDLVNHFGIAPDTIHTIFNGVDIPEIATDAQTTTMDSARPVELIAIGRLNVQKGFDNLLHALGRIRTLPWHLSVLGVGEEKESLERIAREVQIADRVDFVGWQDNPRQWLQRSDIFVLSSRWEGMPNVLLEAMSMGIPTVATDCPTGPRLLLDNGRVGKLVANHSNEQLADAIATLIQDPEQRQELGRLGREQSRHYSTENMVSRFSALIDLACDSQS